jgi:ParB/RepB/Spo0J family partition protein
MKVISEIFLLEPTLVIVEDRQRSVLNKESLAELKDSIALYGVLSPIVVRQSVNGPVLIFGLHRLTACLELGISVPAFYFESLSIIDAKVLELTENIKRSDLSWIDKVKAIGEIHALHKAEDKNWNNTATAKELSLSNTYIGQVLTVYPFLGSKKLEAATSITHAFNILSRLADRQAAAIVGEMIGVSNDFFKEETERPISIETDSAGSEKSTEVLSLATGISKNDFIGVQVSSSNRSVKVNVSKAVSTKNEERKSVPVPHTKGAILNESFLEWATTYSGSKFTLVHCDFPYGVFHGANAAGGFGSTFDGTANSQEALYENTQKIYYDLLDSFVVNFDKFASYSCHVIFWFSMNFYEETKEKLESIGLRVQPHPFIWHKSDSKGVSPWPHGPKKIYDTAFICSRGDRQMIKQGTNAYSGPTPTNKIHPSEKSEAMLKYFLSSYIDETTTVFDPTCGSGVALRAAEDLGAKEMLGLEINSEYAVAANHAMLKARALRKLK